MKRKRSRRAYTPAPASAQRKAIAAAIRVPCQRELKQNVILRFEHFKVSGDWAFARVEPLHQRLCCSDSAGRNHSAFSYEIGMMPSARASAMSVIT